MVLAPAIMFVASSAVLRGYFAGLTKKGLQKGEWRYLSEGEVNILKMGAYI